MPLHFCVKKNHNDSSFTFMGFLMRAGPHPLPIFYGMAAANMEGMQLYSGCSGTPVSEDDLVSMMRGIELYKNHQYTGHQRALFSQILLGQDGAALLSHKVYDLSSKRVMLLIPSLINSSAVFDLHKDKSFLRWIAAQNIDAYILDWGNLNIRGEDPFAFIISTIEQAVIKLTKDYNVTPDLLGYCMGGTLSAAFASLRGELINKLVLLAAPWDFHVRDATLSDHVRSFTPQILPQILQRGNLPSSWLQSLFLGIAPKEGVEKFKRFSELEQDSFKAELFVDVEDWLNSGGDLPAGIAKQCLVNWFAKNEPYKGEWRINGKIIDPSCIINDTLIITSNNDRLVHKQSALSLHEQMSGKKSAREILIADCGHVGFMAGSRCEEAVWKNIAEYLKK